MEVLDYEFCLYVWLRMHCISPIFFLLVVPVTLSTKRDKKNIRQDLQDHPDRRAFGLRGSRRRRKNLYPVQFRRTAKLI